MCSHDPDQKADNNTLSIILFYFLRGRQTSDIIVRVKATGSVVYFLATIL